MWHDRVGWRPGGQDTFGCVEKERVDVAELFLQASAETLYGVIGPLNGLDRRWIYVAQSSVQIICLYEEPSRTVAGTLI